MTGLSLSISPLLLDYRRNNPVLSTLQKTIHASNNARRFSGRRPRRRTLKECKRKGRHYATLEESKRKGRYVTLIFSDEEWRKIRKGAESK